MTDNSAQWPPPTYRTREEADAWLPKARAILEEIERRVPVDRIAIDKETLFVGTLVPEIVGCVAVSLVGIRGQFTALEFPVDSDFQQTVALQARRLLQWRERVEAEITEREPED
jgi:hypothetical protein